MLWLTCAQAKNKERNAAMVNVADSRLLYYLQAWAHLCAQANNKERNAAMVSVVADFRLLSPGLGSPARK
jgi:hypothetical protein